MGLVITETAPGRLTVTDHGNRVPGVYADEAAAECTTALNFSTIEDKLGHIYGSEGENRPLTVADMAPLLGGYIPSNAAGSGTDHCHN